MSRPRAPGWLTCGTLFAGVAFSCIAWGLADAVERLRRRLYGGY